MGVQGWECGDGSAGMGVQGRECRDVGVDDEETGMGVGGVSRASTRGHETLGVTGIRGSIVYSPTLHH